MLLQDIVRRLKMGQSINAIKSETGRHRTVIRKLKELALEHGWFEPEEELPSEAELQELYHGGHGVSQTGSHVLDPYAREIEDWLKDHYRFVVIHRLLRERGVPYSETTIRRFIHRRFPKKIRPVMRRATIPGEVMEVDFGYLGLTWDPQAGARRRTWFFSGRLRHSRRVYREVVNNQKHETFFWCHIHAFEYFGGVPQKVTPDNLKAAIIIASFEDPLVNRAYRSLAEHYRFLISPCLPRHPEHKGGVESDVKYVKRNFLPLFREHQKQRGHEPPYADELVGQLARWNDDTYDLHIVQTVGRTPLDLFDTEEAQTLQPLPPDRWDPVTCKEAKVGADWRIQFDKAFYTVPYELIASRVLVMADSRIVRIFADLQEVTNHPRAAEPWQVRRKAQHAPPELERYLNISTEGLVQWAERLGACVAAVAREIFADQAVDGLRPVRALIRLADKYTVPRLEAACQRAVRYRTPTYRSVKDILVNGLDQLPEERPADPPTGQVQFRFERERGYFDVSELTEEGTAWMN